MEPEKLFGTTDPVVLAQKTDQFVKAMQGAPAGTYTQDPASGASVFKAANADSGFDPIVSAALNKALSADQIASVQGALVDVQKDLTPSSPLSSGYVAYDLEPQIAMLRFVETPIRNRTPRTKGQGKGYQFKRITGATGLGGPANIAAIRGNITDATQTRFDNPGSSNALWLNRPPKISYAGDEIYVPYTQTGLSDELSWSTQLTALGFTDPRAMSRTTLMLAHMAIEERKMLLDRGTQSGYSGALTGPSGTPTGAARTKAAGEVGISGVTTNIYVKVTADAGDFGQSVLSSVSAAIAVTNGQVVDVTVPTDVVGAVGYRVYVSTGSSDPGDSARWYMTRGGSNVITLQGPLPTSGTAASTVTADTSADAGSYDGIVPVCLGPNSGYVNRVNSTLSTSNPGAEFQTVFAGLWDSVKARPRRALFSGSDFKQLNESIRNGGSGTSYRLTIGQPDVHGIAVGSIVSSIINETAGGGAGDDVIPEVHAYLPQGVVPVLTDELPMPSQGVTNIWESRNLQDVMAIEWPVLQLSYDASTYQFGTFFCRAPGYQGAVAGIKKA